ncbi:MAG: hypothetical protein M1840_001908 [Geoglossum simile]|nr:MAG: hypothetical protein M1840_001908 [Geoglossum simile]
MTDTVSSTRLYLGNLPRNVTRKDIEDHFKKHGAGEITEVKLMSGFGFIEYKDSLDAMDVVPDGSDFMGERLTVQFARGPRHRDAFTNSDRSIPRPRRTPHRMQITGLPSDASWQDLKDFARGSNLDVVYSEVGRDRDGKGFVEFETAADLRTAVEKLDHQEFKNSRVTCVADTQEERPRERGRSRSPPPPRRGLTPPADYDRRGPRGYTSPPRRHDYRERSPRREYYDRDSRDRYRSPPRARGPPDDGYPPPRRGYPEDPYDRAPRRGGFDEPYPPANGYGRHERALSPPRRPRSPGRGYHDYDRRAGYW